MICPNCNHEFDDPMGDKVGKVFATGTMAFLALIAVLLVLRFVLVPLVRGMVG